MESVDAINLNISQVKELEEPVDFSSAKEKGDRAMEKRKKDKAAEIVAAEHYFDFALNSLILRKGSEGFSVKDSVANFKKSYRIFEKIKAILKNYGIKSKIVNADGRINNTIFFGSKESLHDGFQRPVVSAAEKISPPQISDSASSASSERSNMRGAAADFASPDSPLADRSAVVSPVKQQEDVPMNLSPNDEEVIKRCLEKSKGKQETAAFLHFLNYCYRTLKENQVYFVVDLANFYTESLQKVIYRAYVNRALAILERGNVIKTYAVRYKTGIANIALLSHLSIEDDFVQDYIENRRPVSRKVVSQYSGANQIFTNFCTFQLDSSMVSSMYYRIKHGYLNAKMLRLILFHELLWNLFEERVAAADSSLFSSLADSFFIFELSDVMKK